MRLCVRTSAATTNEGRRAYGAYPQNEKTGISGKGLNCVGSDVCSLRLFQVCQILQNPPADQGINVYPLFLRMRKEFVYYFRVKRHFHSQDMGQWFRKCSLYRLKLIQIISNAMGIPPAGFIFMAFKIWNSAFFVSAFLFLLRFTSFHE
jgi:hypothetical protein